MADLERAEQLLKTINTSKYSTWMSSKLWIAVVAIGVLLYLGRANVMSVIDTIKWIVIVFLGTRALHDIMIEWRATKVKVALIEALSKDGTISAEDASVINKAT